MDQFSGSNSLGKRPRGVRLSEKIGLTISTILLFTILLTSSLNYFNFERSYSDIVRSTYTVMLRDISYVIHYGMGLGLSLASMDNIRAMIPPDIAHDSIYSVQVFDQHGTILFYSGSDSDRVDTQVPDHWLKLALEHSDITAVWSTEAPDAYVIGQTLINNFDVIEGGIVLVFSRAEAETTLAQVRMLLTKQSLLILLLFSFASLVFTWLIIRRLSRNLMRMEASLMAVEAGRPPTFSSMSSDAFEQEFIAFQDAVVKATVELEQARCKEQV